MHVVTRKSYVLYSLIIFFCDFLQDNLIFGALISALFLTTNSICNASSFERCLVREEANHLSFMT